MMNARLESLVSLTANTRNQIWPAFAGGCRLDGTMDLALKAMDGWESIEVRPLEGQKAFASIPYVTGRAVKA